MLIIGMFLLVMLLIMIIYFWDNKKERNTQGLDVVNFTSLIYYGREVQ